MDKTVELPALQRDWTDASGEDGFTVADLGARLLEDLEISALDGLRGQVPDEVIELVEKGLQGGMDQILDQATEALQGELGEQAGELLDLGKGLLGGR